jgi:hypothetical protein
VEQESSTVHTNSASLRPVGGETSRLDFRLDGIEHHTSSLQRLLKTATIAQSLLQAAPRLHHQRHQEEDLLPGHPNYRGHTTEPGLDTRRHCTPRGPVPKKRRQRR